jgi:membrane protease subunit HflK
MRRSGAPSEVRRLAAPLARLLDGAWQRMHWWVALMAVLYALSGITIVRPDEQAVVLRWGRLVGSTPALQQHGPGLLLALPRPVDEVVRVKVRRVSELTLTTLASVDPWNSQTTLDPLREGYALTGDRNVVHVDLVARYRVRDPAAWALHGPPAEPALRATVTAAMVRSLGEMPVDAVLADGRERLLALATKRAQEGLDEARSGLQLVALELTRLAPPIALAPDFAAVQSAYIAAETRRKEALAFAQVTVPQAHATAEATVQAARAEAATRVSRARGEAAAFRALAAEHRANPRVTRERLYREAVDRALRAAGSLRWVPPPPTGGRYHGLRISIDPTTAGPAEATTDGNLGEGPH